MQVLEQQTQKPTQPTQPALPPVATLAVAGSLPASVPATAKATPANSRSETAQKMRDFLMEERKGLFVDTADGIAMLRNGKEIACIRNWELTRLWSCKCQEKTLALHIIDALVIGDNYRLLEGGKLINKVTALVGPRAGTHLDSREARLAAIDDYFACEAVAEQLAALRAKDQQENLQIRRELQSQLENLQKEIMLLLQKHQPLQNTPAEQDVTESLLRLQDNLCRAFALLAVPESGNVPSRAVQGAKSANLMEYAESVLARLAYLWILIGSTSGGVAS